MMEQTWMTTTDKGGAQLTLPRDITDEDLGDLQEWFSIILRSLRRRYLPQSGAVDPVDDRDHEPSTREKSECVPPVKETP